MCLAFCFVQFHVGSFEIPANHVRLQARSQDFSCVCVCGGGGGGCIWAVKIQICRGVRGHAPLGKF